VRPLRRGEECGIAGGGEGGQRTLPIGKLRKVQVLLGLGMIVLIRRRWALSEAGHLLELLGNELLAVLPVPGLG
jgi:hypothetical protein